MLFSDGFWIILLIISITYNLYFLVQVRRYQARLKYLKKDNENFLNKLIYAKYLPVGSMKINTYLKDKSEHLVFKKYIMILMVI